MKRILYSLFIIVGIFGVYFAVQERDAPFKIIETNNATNHSMGPKLSAPNKKKVTENGVEHEFSIRQYTPPYVVKTVKKENATYETPEKTIASIWSSGQSQDLQWYKKCFAKNAFEDSTEIQVRKKMKLALGLTKIELVRKIKYKEKYIIVTRMHLMGNDEIPPFAWTLPTIFVKNDEGRFVVVLQSKLSGKVNNFLWRYWRAKDFKDKEERDSEGEENIDEQ